jgi:hypothetical protein
MVDSDGTATAVYSTLSISMAMVWEVGVEEAIEVLKNGY